jgi:hypothetical protein
MENKIPTAEELCRIEYDDNRPENIFMERSVDMKWAIFMMKQFAKLHVKAAIKECIESAPSGSSTDTVSYEDVVKALKDCYPLNLIK